MVSGASALSVTDEQRAEIRFCVAFRIAELEQRAKIDAKHPSSATTYMQLRETDELATLRGLLSTID